MQAPFCSRDTRFKSPFGALPAGDTLRLRLFLEEMPDRPVEAVFLELRPDDQKQPDRLPLSPDEDGEGGRWWTVETALPTGLYWYRFSWQDQDGSHPITRFDGGWGGFSDQGAEWQLTVYDKEFSTPGWRTISRATVFCGTTGAASPPSAWTARPVPLATTISGAI